ncbi:MAG: hypothetical protein ACLVBD_13350 [Hominilimicola sp.]|uniref:hypothetical protein n=1 Tax=Hominilimicola sp. TaxID=3073571 RepID=UPI00399B6E3E
MIRHILCLPTDILMSILQRSNLRRIRRVGKSEIFMYRATQKDRGQPTRAGLLSRDDRQGCDDIFRILDNNGLTFGDMFDAVKGDMGLETTISQGWTLPLTTGTKRRSLP